MRFEVLVDNQLPTQMQNEIVAGERAVTQGIGLAGRRVKQAWRDQISEAGLGPRLARSVQMKMYPEGQNSASAASVVYTKAPKIIAAQDAGPLIRSQDGFWLAIPTPEAGKGLRGGRITPGEWEARRGIKLRFVYRPGQPGLLVADMSRINTRGLAVGDRRRRRVGFQGPMRSVVIFVLVRQVKLRKKLNLERLAADAAASLPGLIRAAWRTD